MVVPEGSATSSQEWQDDEGSKRWQYGNFHRDFLYASQGVDADVGKHRQQANGATQYAYGFRQAQAYVPPVGAPLDLADYFDLDVMK